MEKVKMMLRMQCQGKSCRQRAEEEATVGDTAEDWCGWTATDWVPCHT